MSKSDGTEEEEEEEEEDVDICRNAAVRAGFRLLTLLVLLEKEEWGPVEARRRVVARPATAVVGRNAARRVDGKSTALVCVVVAAKTTRRRPRSMGGRIASSLCCVDRLFGGEMETLLSERGP